MNKEQFGILLTTLRKEKGLSQKEMAERLSVSTSAVSKWEHGKNLPDMTMLGNIADILQVSCDELHNPEKTLEKLANPEFQEKNEHQKKKNSRIVRISCLVGILGIIAGMFFGYMIAHREPNVQQVCTRYIDDPAWGKVYEIAYVVDGEMTNASINEHLEKVGNTLNQEEIGTDIVKTAYYDNKEDAMAWRGSDVGGYVFLDVE